MTKNSMEFFYMAWGVPRGPYTWDEFVELAKSEIIKHSTPCIFNDEPSRPASEFFASEWPEIEKHISEKQNRSEQENQIEKQKKNDKKQKQEQELKPFRENNRPWIFILSYCCLGFLAFAVLGFWIVGESYLGSYIFGSIALTLAIPIFLLIRFPKGVGGFFDSFYELMGMGTITGVFVIILVLSLGVALFKDVFNPDHGTPYKETYDDMTQQALDHIKRQRIKMKVMESGFDEKDVRMWFDESGLDEELYPIFREMVFRENIDRVEKSKKHNY